MPNHVCNDVTITGPLSDLKKIKKLMAGPDSEFDFNKLIPMPKELLSIAEGGTTIDGNYVSRWREIDGKSIAVSEKELAELKKKYGADGWYQWANRNWGTKWNAYNMAPPRLQKNRLAYNFDTAWNTPRPIFEALAERFPKIGIRVDISGEVDSRWTDYYGAEND